MPDRPATRQVCVLMRAGLVLTDDRGRLPSYEAEQDWDDLARRTRTCGDHRAVLVAPQLHVRSDPAVVLSVSNDPTILVNSTKACSPVPRAFSVMKALAASASSISMSSE